MTKEKFIAEIAKYVQKYAPQYDIKVHSPIIAQACLESAYGTSELAVNAHNYFGLKYRPNRCPSANGIYYKNGSEQNADGSYSSSAMQWMKFDSLEKGVKGYFEFINVANYNNLKGVTDPKTYLENIKKDGYATSLKYVDNLMNYISKLNLTKYDNIEETKEKNKTSNTTGYSNSSLVNCVIKSPNHSGRRTHKIDTISVHCVVGQLTAEGIGNCFTSKSRQASCNYGIGKDGRVVLVVDEANRSWCTSSAANDQRAITIEVASDKTHPYAFTNAAYEKLVALCTDICRRNGIKKLLWLETKEKSLAYVPKNGEAILTAHRWFATKACPGDWMYAREGDLANRVTAALGGNTTSNKKENVTTNKTGVPYTVRVTADVLRIRNGPGVLYANNGDIRDKGVYTIIEEKNGWGKLKSGAGWISLEYTQKK